MAIDGKWNVTAQTAMGAQTFTLVLLRSGDSFTGSMSNALGAQDIAGTIDGDALSWTTEMATPVALTLEYAAVIQGDQLTGSVKAGPYGTTALAGTRA